MRRHSPTGCPILIQRPGGYSFLNSGADLEPLRQLVNKRNSFGKEVEFLSIKCTPLPEGFTYGFSEMEMFDAGIAQSKLASLSTRFIKLTGRLTFPRLGKLLDWLPDNLRWVWTAGFGGRICLSRRSY